MQLITTRQLNTIRKAEEQFDIDLFVNENTTEIEASLIIEGLRKTYSQKLKDTTQKNTNLSSGVNDSSLISDTPKRIFTEEDGAI